VGRRRTAERLEGGRDGDAGAHDTVGADAATSVGTTKIAPGWARPATHRRAGNPRQLRMLKRENEELRAHLSRLERENAQLRRMVANEQLRILALRSLAKGSW
jgi:hypothetical protein